MPVAVLAHYLFDRVPSSPPADTAPWGRTCTWRCEDLGPVVAAFARWHIPYARTNLAKYEGIPSHASHHGARGHDGCSLSSSTSPSWTGEKLFWNS